jgi:hypothetical protein
LKVQATPPSLPSSLTRKDGPVSRTQLSSCGIGRTEMPLPQCSDASAVRSGRASTVTGSNAAIAWATPA